MTHIALPNDLLDWLLAGDVAIQYQVRRDLLDEERPDLRRASRPMAGAHSSWLLAGPTATGAGGFTSPSGSADMKTMLIIDLPMWEVMRGV